MSLSPQLPQQPHYLPRSRDRLRSSTLHRAPQAMPCRICQNTRPEDGPAGTTHTILPQRQGHRHETELTLPPHHRRAAELTLPQRQGHRHAAALTFVLSSLFLILVHRGVCVFCTWVPGRTSGKSRGCVSQGVFSLREWRERRTF